MGICGLANVLKLEGAKYNIKVNVLAPGAGTRLTEDVFPPDRYTALLPELVTPAVMYLCSEQCEDTGFYINAAGGRFSRSNIVTSPDVFIEDPTAEKVAENWSKIIDLTDAKYYANVLDTARTGETGGLVRPPK